MEMNYGSSEEVKRVDGSPEAGSPTLARQKEGETVKILDHGYLKVIESWGSDERIIEAARMSTGKGFLGWDEYLLECKYCKCVWRDNGDNTVSLANVSQKSCKQCEFDTDHACKKIKGDGALLAFLWNNRHATPFEMAGMVIEVQAPIFVFREWHRHRTQSYNELSARYTPISDVNYMPSPERCLMVSGTNKQAGAIAEGVTHEKALRWLAELEQVYARCEEVYQNGLKDGIPKEVARLPVPVGRYSRMRASANLRNWLAFLTLRMDPAAQWEIRQYANAVGEAVAAAFPRTWALFVEGRAK